MKASIKREWLRRLRSGKYKQARNTLEERTPSGKVKGNCCWGVLCRIAVDEGVAKVKVDYGSGYAGTKRKARCTIFIDKLGGTGVGFPSDEILNWAGIDNAMTSYPDVTGKSAIPVGLHSYNDHGYTFAEIADIIEAHVPEEPDEPVVVMGPSSELDDRAWATAPSRGVG